MLEQDQEQGWVSLEVDSSSMQYLASDNERHLFKKMQKKLFSSCCDNLTARGSVNYRLTLSYLIVINQSKGTNIFIRRQV